MAWLYLVSACGFEVIFAIALKYTDGYSKLLPSAIATACAIASVASLSKVLNQIPVGIAYSIWTGVGVVGTNLLAVVLFQESLDFKKVFFIALILGGVYGLYAVSEP
ncbi:cation/cationic drug transporter [Synechococcus sp. PCC 7502]|uniref:DMT family transporter n=1 Tax=Synechococcus sp. PCC 7502 TaxID=1173263 RepID=UPI00029FFFF5|nr:multidrug efflux SMR transporter [Synechococcus sp. PCC 7502]AFY73660.1 cation/cationic drug transporter [Synechococcus sp. PCC 7502]